MQASSSPPGPEPAGSTMSRQPRQALPQPAEKEPPLNLWTLLKDWVGKVRAWRAMRAGAGSHALRLRGGDGAALRAAAGRAEPVAAAEPARAHHGADEGGGGHGAQRAAGRGAPARRAPPLADERPRRRPTSLPSAQAAALPPRSVERLLRVAAFALAPYATGGAAQRARKPLDPMLGGAAPVVTPLLRDAGGAPQPDRGHACRRQRRTCWRSTACASSASRRGSVPSACRPERPGSRA